MEDHFPFLIMTFCNVALLTVAMTHLFINVFLFYFKKWREGCMLRSLHWKITCLPSNKIWLINCISLPKSPNIKIFLLVCQKQELWGSNFPTIQLQKAKLDIGPWINILMLEGFLWYLTKSTQNGNRPFVLNS